MSDKAGRQWNPSEDGQHKASRLGTTGVLTVPHIVSDDVVDDGTPRESEGDHGQDSASLARRADGNGRYKGSELLLVDCVDYCWHLVVCAGYRCLENVLEAKVVQIANEGRPSVAESE